MKPVPVLDEGTYNKIVRATILARYQGRTVATVLNEQGLIWTPTREHLIRVATMRFLLEEMSTWTPAEFLRRQNKSLESATPAQMYMCIREWIQEHLAHAQIRTP